MNSGSQNYKGEKMICKSCGIKNTTGNNFCTNCGEDLLDIESTSQIKCHSCGSSNEKENKYCTSCGNRLQTKSQIVPQNQKRNTQKPLIKGQKKKEKHKNRNIGKQNFNGVKIFWITTAIVLFAIFIPTTLTSVFEKDIKDGTIMNEVKSSNPVVETKVYDIASKFVCSCGSCNEESLEICKCERAIEERQFIRDYLEQNQKTDDIVIAVANKFGWIKAEFASNFKIDSSRIWSPSVKLISKDLIPNDATNIVSNSESIPWNTVCPIKGEKIDPAVKTVVFDGKTYGFCCTGCDSEFLLDPQTYSKNLNDDGTRFIKG